MKLLAFLSTLATVSAFTPANVGRTTSSLFMRLVYVLLHIVCWCSLCCSLTNYIYISYYISDEAKVAGTVKWWVEKLYCYILTIYCNFEFLLIQLPISHISLSVLEIMYYLHWRITINMKILKVWYSQRIRVHYPRRWFWRCICSSNVN